MRIFILKLKPNGVLRQEKEARSREIENLKIAIPDSLKPIYEKIRTL